MKRRWSASGIRNLALLALACALSMPAEAGRRAIRVDLGGWDAHEMGEPACPHASTQSLLVEWRGFTFAGLPGTDYLTGPYCQTANLEFKGTQLAFADEPNLAGLVGPNADHTIGATRYTFLDTELPIAEPPGFQWAFYSFPDGFTLVGLYGLRAGGVDVPLDDSTYIRRGAELLWAAGRDGFDGEYFCFNGSQYLGRWDGEFTSPPSPCLAFILARPLVAQTVSRSQRGAIYSAKSDSPAISPDGRRVAFASFADDLVPNSQNALNEVFLFDRAQATIGLASSDVDGFNANSDSNSPALSGDGRFLAFVTAANNLGVEDTNGRADVYLKHLQSGDVESISGGGPMTGCVNPALSFDGSRVAYLCGFSGFFVTESIRVRNRTTGAVDVIASDTSITLDPVMSPPAVSANGEWVAFGTSSALVAADTNMVFDVYAWRAANGTFERISVAGNGSQSDGPSTLPAISADGCVVAFESTATNLVTGDTNAASDVFVRDRCAGTTERVSVMANGAQTSSGGDNIRPSLSSNGRFVAFQSHANEFGTQANVFDGVSVVRRRFGGAPDTRIVNARFVAGHDYDRFARNPVISADGTQVAVHVGTYAGEEQVIALPQPFTGDVADLQPIFANGFE